MNIIIKSNILKNINRKKIITKARRIDILRRELNLAIEEAKKICEVEPLSCPVAWDIVEELSSALLHEKQKEKDKETLFELKNKKHKIININKKNELN